MAKEKVDRRKANIAVSTIGHIEHRKTTLTAAITKVLAKHNPQVSLGAPSPEISVESVIDRAIEVMGDRDEAMRWLGTPVRALDYATPISLLGTSEGATRVEDVLGQMEHGVW